MSARPRQRAVCSAGGHIGPPLRGPKGIREPTEIGVKGRATGRDGARAPYGGERSRPVCPGRRGVVTPPCGGNAGSAQQRADVPKAWLPPAKFRAEIWGVSHRHRPLRNETGACRECQGSALSAERVAGQIRVLPDDLRVQHGAEGSKVSAKPRPCSRRDHLK